MANGAVDRRTPNTGLAELKFDFPNWGDEYNKNTRIIDSLLGTVVGRITGPWEILTVYQIGDRVVSTTSGSIYEAQIAHTSPASGTIEDDIIVNPTRWRLTTSQATFRGTWATALRYSNNSFVIVNNAYYVATQDHTSGVFATDLAAGKWVLLVDITPFLAIINETAASTVQDAENAAELARFYRDQAQEIAGFNPGDYQLRSEKNVANGYAGLDAQNFVPAARLRTATTNAAGIVELATNVETATGTDAGRAVTPSALKPITDTLALKDMSNAELATTAARGAVQLADAADLAAKTPGQVLTADLVDQIGGAQILSNRRAIGNHATVYGPIGSGGAGSAIAIPVNTIAYIPIYLPDDITITAMVGYVNTAVSGASVNLAIYSSNDIGYPEDLILNAGTFAATSVGIKIITGLSQVLPKGLYFFAMKTISAATVSMRGIADAASPSLALNRADLLTVFNHYRSNNSPVSFPATVVPSTLTIFGGVMPYVGAY